MPAFLDAETFSGDAWAKNPEWNTDLAQAMLDVVGDWISDRLPNIGFEDSAAQLVSFEVTRDALMTGVLGPYKQFEKRTAHSSRSYTIDRAVVEKLITDRHREMLGLPTFPRPAYHFGD